jgi:hypothetical protein
MVIIYALIIVLIALYDLVCIMDGQKRIFNLEKDEIGMQYFIAISIFMSAIIVFNALVKLLTPFVTGG